MIVSVDLFSGAGGMSLGAVNAGIDVRLAVEADRHAANTYAHNHPKTKVFLGDVRALTRKDLNIEGDTTILFGGPPCQGFSTSNQKTRNVTNKDNWLFQEFFRIAELWQPDWIILENVHGLLETGKGFFFKEIQGLFNKNGYSSLWWDLNAVDYGIPQKRKRLFIIGSKNGTVPNEPIVHASKPVTVQDAIGDLPELPNGASGSWMPYKTPSLSRYAESLRGDLAKSPNHLVTRNSELVVSRYKHIHPGGNWEDIPDELMSNYKDHSRCHTGIYHRLKEDTPSVVLGNYRKNMLVHPTQNRGLSVREAARLQSFPDWYEFKGSIGFQQQQVGNAVPPLLAKEVFLAVRNQFH